MIKELHLNNFKKHSHNSFYFTNGLNGIFGPNYTGKTSILYAILYALGGASHVPGTNIQKKGSASGLSVKMVFEISPHTYTVERKKTGAYLYKDKALLASGTSNVTKEIEEILGMSIKRFKQLKYAEQKKAHALLTLGATELHKIIEELTGIDRVNLVLEKLREIIATTSGSLEVLKKIEMQPLKDGLDDLELELEDCKEKLELNKSQITSVGTEMSKLEQKIREYKKQEESWNHWHKQVERLQSSIAECSRTIEGNSGHTFGGKKEERQKEIVKLQFKYEKQKAFIEYVKKKQTQLEGLEKNITKAKEMEKGYKEEVDKAQRKLSDIPKDVVEQLALLKSDMKTKWNEIIALSTEVNTLHQLKKESICPTCNRTLDDCDEFDLAIIEQKAAKLVELRSNYSVLEDREKNLTSKKNQFEDANDVIKANLSAMYQVTKDIMVWEREKGELQQELITDMDVLVASREIDQLNTELVRLMAAFKAAETAEEIIASQLDRLETYQMELEALTEPAYSKADKDAAETEIAEMHSSLHILLLSKSEFEMVISSVKDKIDNKKQQIKDAEEQNAVYWRVHSRNSAARLLQKYLRDNRDRYVSSIWDFFLSSASEFASNCTDGSISSITRSEDGTFQFTENEHIMTMKDASGAQEAIMGIAVQSALAESAQCPLDILLVDEPTADMDAEHSLAVTGMLSTKGRQVIAISHREMDSTICSNMINLGD